jgi:hypothetical protein
MAKAIARPSVLSSQSGFDDARTLGREPRPAKSAGAARSGEAGIRDVGLA